MAISRANLAKIHIARKETGMDEQTYRDILWSRFKRRSAAELSDRQAFVLLNDEFIRLRGWRPSAPLRGRPGVAKKAASGKALPGRPWQKKIRALWLTLRDLGVLRDPSEQALNAYIKRTTKIERLEWLRSEDAPTVIEPLKGWVARELEAKADGG